MLKTARLTRNRLIVEMGRLIVEADPGVALLLLSVGEPEWKSKRMMAQLLSGKTKCRSECFGKEADSLRMRQR